MNPNSNFAKTLAPLIEILKNNGTGVLEICWRTNFFWEDCDIRLTCKDCRGSIVNNKHSMPSLDRVQSCKSKTGNPIPAKISFSLGERDLGYALIVKGNIEEDIPDDMILRLPLDGKSVPYDREDRTGITTSTHFLYCKILEKQIGDSFGGKAIILLVNEDDELMFEE